MSATTAKPEAIDVTSIDGDIILFCAFRYALGRQTYVVSTLIDTLRRVAPALNPQRRAMYAREIREAGAGRGGGSHTLGDKFDAEAWLKLAAELEAMNARGGQS